MGVPSVFNYSSITLHIRLACLYLQGEPGHRGPPGLPGNRGIQVSEYATAVDSNNLYLIKY